MEDPVHLQLNRTGPFVYLPYEMKFHPKGITLKFLNSENESCKDDAVNDHPLGDFHPSKIVLSLIQSETVEKIIKSLTH